MTPEKFPDNGCSEFARIVDRRDNYHQYSECREKRMQWINKGMYAFVSLEWVVPFAKWINERKCLEVMSGAGWLAKALEDQGIDILATDNYSFQGFQSWELQTKVKKIDCLEAVARYGPFCDILIISWPLMNDAAYYTIKLLHYIKPDTLIVYIGEEFSGCTADENFSQHFEEVEDPEFKEMASKYTAWYKIHDRIRLGKYKP